MLIHDNATALTSPQCTRNEDAVFKRWQKTGSGEVFALYNITATGDPSLVLPLAIKHCTS
jgi:hypothetical protein